MNEKEIQSMIYEAFKDVKLGAGIGYFEANAIDDFLTSNEEEYKQRKAKDERLDWQKIIHTINPEKYNYQATCFMDTEGLLFFLPVLLNVDSSTVLEIILFARDFDIGKSSYGEENLKMLQLLTQKQIECLIKYFEEYFDFDDSIKSLLLPDICEKCGNLRKEAYSIDQAIEEVQQNDYYLVINYLKKFLK